MIGYNVIDEFVTQQTDCNDPMIQSFKNSQPENVYALINFIQTPEQTDLCDAKTGKEDVTIPKKKSLKISCGVNTGPLEQKVPVLFEPSELEQWPAGLEVPEMLLSLKQGNNSIVHVKVFNPTDPDIVLHNRTEIGRLQLFRSVYPIEVKPADSNEAVSQDQEEDVTGGESRKSEEVEELNKKGAKEQDCLGKFDLKGDGVVEKGSEQNGVADDSYEIEKSCNEKGKGISIEERNFIVNQIDISHLDEVQRQKARKLLLEEADSFSHDDDDKGCAKDLVLDLRLKDNTPVQRNYVSFPKPLYPEVKSYIQDLLNHGFIKPSQSPYSSSVLCVRKPDNSLRLCVDYRLLNAKTVADKHPIPKVQVTFENLGGNRWFSTLDQGKAYHHCIMSEKSQSLTAFITPWGLYEFVRIPFGLS